MVPVLGAVIIDSASSKVLKPNPLPPPVMKLPTIACAANAGIRFMMFARRRQDLTPDEYKDYYENHHVPLLKSLAGRTFPLSHKRTYVNRATPDYSAVIVFGEQADFEYDSMSILTLKDQKHYDALFSLYNDNTTGKAIHDDEKNFIEWAKAVIIDCDHVTRGSH
ncbi:unnamed protein product [Clonostachys solani]|uniref:EthD domain-containing protein n=1 Tax=Clonostachys solani TaxID=160281 RepID=A0A9P0EFC4_9HYPO|nr:unnamed protein product [Clonostachys solani]